MQIRVIDTGAATGAWNMAVDDALMDSVRNGAPPVLRFYSWQPRCLSFGRNQPAAGAYNRGLIASRGIDVVRRVTGGRAVLHDRELTYSVAIRPGTLGTPRETYRTINRALLAGLRTLHVSADLVPSGRQRAAVPSLSPCFRDPSEGEVAVDGRKLIGSAQLRHDGVILQHGSLLLENDQCEVRELLTEPGPELESPAVLADLCDPLPTWDVLTAALCAGWATTAGNEPVRTELATAERAAAESMESRYRSLAWTWRR
ncbi:MAG TPA: lipoate--protein ligase family protein [Longimicrobiaceae bacterium]|nr:lipoate--protein ligase family protein [Longimicrobiaceae bacterium]